MTKSMKFKDAVKCLKNGCKVRRKGWGGYWEMNSTGDSIVIHTKDGYIFDIRQTEDVWLTLENIIAKDWEII